MTAGGAAKRDGERDDSDAGPDERSAEERAEEIVARVSEQVARLAVRFVARAREEIEDIVAEAQTLRRADRPPE